MKNNTLSVFIDESGDFGSYETHSPYYLISLILHEQHNNLSEHIKQFDYHLSNLGYLPHAIHTGPLIRRESIYSNDLMEERKRLFNALFNFARKLDFQYHCIKLSKSKFPNAQSMTPPITNLLIQFIQIHSDYLNNFEHIIIYYDNGQTELTKILNSTSMLLYTQVEFRKVKPVDYKLFQIADLICTLELLSIKSDTNTFSHSELDFFGNIRDFKKNYLKHIRKKSI